MDKKQTRSDIMSWLLNVPKWKRYEEWMLDPNNKPLVDELKEALKEKAHIRIGLDELEKE